MLTHAKAYVGGFGATVTAVIAVYGTDSPRWLLAAAAVLTALGVSATPNRAAADPTVGDAPFVPDLVASAEADPSVTA
jgi:hypothetical protein